MRNHTALALLLAAALPAQTVTFRNDSPVRFEGWAPVAIDKMPPHRTGVATNADGATFEFMLGRETGLDTRMLDVRLSLAPGQVVTITLDKAKALDIARAPLPENPIKWFGGFVTMHGAMLQIATLDFDGAGYSCHLRGRFTPMLFADVWIHWCADQPWAQGEALITASNCTVPDLGAEVPDDLRLKFGDANVLVPGRRVDQPLVDAGTWIGDGQARAVCFTLFWPRHTTKPEQWSSIGCLANLGLCSVGVSKLLHEGNPRYPASFDARAWTTQRLAESFRRMQTWEQGVVGPNKRSGDTGAQEDQTFVRGEALQKNGVGAERIALLGAYRMASRPCHHLEANGEQVDVTNHTNPRLVYWDSRPHWHSGVSPDRLGKPAGVLFTNGWFGSDVEHAFQHTMINAGRLTGSPLVQHLMSAQARVFRLMWTTDPELIYQSVPFAARAVGWEADLVVGLWRNLQDRELAERTKAHWLDRATKVLVPQLGSMPGDVWDWRRDDRIGPGIRYMPWQQAVGAYFLVLAGDVFGHKEVRDVGIRAARAVVRDAYWFNGERWTAREVVAQDGAAVPSGSYDFFGTPLAIAALMRAEPNSVVVLADGSKCELRLVWTQLLKEADSTTQCAWIAPGIK